MPYRIIETAMHRAAFCPLSGVGLLVMPDPASDLWLGLSSLIQSDYSQMVRSLRAEGVRIVPGDDGEPWCELGHTPDSGVAIALMVVDPIDSGCDPVRELAVTRELAAMFGVRLSAA